MISLGALEAARLGTKLTRPSVGPIPAADALRRATLLADDLPEKLGSGAPGLWPALPVRRELLLKAFTNEVKVQRGKEIAPGTAATLTASANQIVAVLA